MTETNEHDVYSIVTTILYKMVQDIGIDEDIKPTTWLVSDLGFESIDIVVFGTTLQEHFENNLPLAEFLMEIGRRDPRDIRVDEFVAFVEKQAGD